MNQLESTKSKLLHRKSRIRKVVSGSASRPRLSVYISNLHINAQLIDDEKSETIGFVTTIGAKLVGVNLTQKAQWVGTEIAKVAKAKKIKQVVFDRNGRLYHGRVKALADKAREGGLEF